MLYSYTRPQNGYFHGDMISQWMERYLSSGPTLLRYKLVLFDHGNPMSRPPSLQGLPTGSAATGQAGYWGFKPLPSGNQTWLGGK